MFYKNLDLQKQEQGKYNILIKVSDGMIITIPVSEDALEKFFGLFRQLKQER